MKTYCSFGSLGKGQIKRKSCVFILSEVATHGFQTTSYSSCTQRLLTHQSTSNSLPSLLPVLYIHFYNHPVYPVHLYEHFLHSVIIYLSDECVKRLHYCEIIQKHHSWHLFSNVSHIQATACSSQITNVYPAHGKHFFFQFEHNQKISVCLLILCLFSQRMCYCFQQNLLPGYCVTLSPVFRQVKKNVSICIHLNQLSFADDLQYQPQHVH